MARKEGDKVAEALAHNELGVAGEAALYRAMRHFWHPVMYVSALGEDP